MSESTARPARPRPRRRAVYISEADQARIDQGLKPSWEDGPGDGLSTDTGSGTENDARIVENIPPHAQPKL
ncbi:hypothetical protein [Boudabousia marimammalium]|uniref:Toxin n=1 Tax=Boudabousia marimammalium TaxID=156892 RepID=A0A1Q5PL48_9ACTO|nr:hypothetical protein [Boudabousia marimammalium]OKL47363.1 hypothetical protein BM477_06765 [Boudabousia marimammalium]